MAKRIDLPAPRGAKMPTGKGWRLVTPSKRRWFKATLHASFYSLGERYAVYRVLP
jgi:hypothetical protein